MKLISMTEFVLEQVQNSKYEEFEKVNETFVNKVINYANFLNQPLTLGMFVPCDEDGNVLEYPFAYNFKFIELFTNYNIRYQEAKEKVLFEGFKVIHNGKFGTLLMINEYQFTLQEFKKIEYLLKYNPTLTPNAIKKLNL